MNNDSFEGGARYVACCADATTLTNLSRKRTVALLVDLDEASFGNTKVLRDLGFNVSERTVACDTCILNSRNCANVFVSSSQGRGDDTELDFWPV